MKKNLLTLGLLAIGTCAYAQVLTYVGPGAEMTITSSALVYSGGGWQNASSGSEKGTVNNFGNVMVVSPATETNTKFEVAPESFHLKFGEGDLKTASYGQLYIKDVNQANITGKVVKEFKAEPTSTTGRQQVGLPFYNLTIGDLKAATNVDFQITSTSTRSATSGRFHPGSIFKWNNQTARFDQIGGTGVTESTVLGKATDYYIVPRRTGSNIVWDTSSLTTIEGIAVGDNSNDTNAFTTNFVKKGDIDFGPSKGFKNNGYNEAYNSYLHDPFVSGDDASAWRLEGLYGKRLMQFANPFLTNLDLSNIGTRIPGDTDGVALTSVVGVAYYDTDAFSWISRSGTSYNQGNTTVITFSNGNPVAGDVTKLIIKPMQEVMIKFGTDDQQTINLNNLRTFSSTPRTVANYGVTARKANKTNSSVARQVGVVLLNENGLEIGRTYYVVAPYVESGYQASESKLQAISGNSVIYTKEELKEGGEDTSVANNLYINEANENNFKGKEIPMVVNFPEKGSLTFELYENGVRLDSGSSLSNGVDFYIKNGNTITKIKDSDTIAKVDGAYGLFYDQPAGTLNSVDVTKYNTVVAKKEKDWVVRFANSWKNAKVEIYSATGQLIHVKNNVNTSTDYVLPFDNVVNGIFVVKATSENGEVVVKKVIK